MNFEDVLPKENGFNVPIELSAYKACIKQLSRMRQGRLMLTEAIDTHIVLLLAPLQSG
jgi:hypothetical protein